MSDPLLEYLLRLGDTTLILGHRLGEWCGHAPTVEEDIALANTALDLVGQTRLWLGLAAEVESPLDTREGRQSLANQIDRSEEHTSTSSH